jgi:hypothetical protein
MNTQELEIKIIKLINGDDVVCAFPSKQLPEKSPLMRLVKPLQVKYVPQLTPDGFKDYIALIKWAAYTPDTVVTIPKDKIMTIVNASEEMKKSYIHIASSYDSIKPPTQDDRKYTQEKLNYKDNEELNEIFDEFKDTKDTIH